MSLTINVGTYANDTSPGPDSFRYHGPNHTLSNKDEVVVGRTAPKPTDTFAGKGRARFKLTRGATDGTDSLNSDMIVDINVSIPVGTADAEQDALITDVATWLATTSAKDLFKDHDIVQ